MPAFTPRRLLPVLSAFPSARRCWIAYSGGLDSEVLLDALAALRGEISAEIQALHLDHGLHPDSPAWSRHCARSCARLGVPLTVRRLELVRKKGESLEAQARDARYGALAGFMEDGDLLLILRAGTQEGRLQARLQRCGQAWEPGRVAPAGLPYSGHPELLRLADGAVLHVATTGVSYTLDEGATWNDLVLDDGLAGLRSANDVPYYPRSVQLADGSVLILGHVGGDNGYGCVDQSIVGLRFQVHR